MFEMHRMRSRNCHPGTEDIVGWPKIGLRSQEKLVQRTDSRFPRPNNHGTMVHEVLVKVDVPINRVINIYEAVATNISTTSYYNYHPVAGSILGLRNNPENY